MDPKRVLIIDGDYCYEAIDFAVGRLNLSKRLNKDGKPIFTCYRLQEDHNDLTQVQLILLNLHEFTDVQSLAGLPAGQGPDLNKYVVFQPEETVLWQYTCKPAQVLGRLGSAVAKMKHPEKIVSEHFMNEFRIALNEWFQLIDPKKGGFVEQYFNARELLQNVFRFSTTVFFATHIDQITKQLLEMNQLYIELEPKFTRSKDSPPCELSASKEEKEFLLEGSGYLPISCYSYQVV